MRLAIFGAGASLGSQESDVPPLGADLFSALVAFSPTVWGSLPSPWPDRFRQDFEEAMSGFISGGGFGAPLQWAMAAFFFKSFKPSRDNLYGRFLRDIKGHTGDIALVTLNYDRLLQLCASAIGAGIVVGAKDFQSDKIPLCLPHGSSCIACQGIQMSGGISFSGGISTGGRPFILHTDEDFDKERQQNVLPPVMSYFEPKKFTVSCANFIESEREQFARWVSQAERIAIVGLQVRPGDRHIWDHLAATKAQLMFLSGETGGVQYRQWASNMATRNPDEAVPKFFADGYDELSSFLFG